MACCMTSRCGLRMLGPLIWSRLRHWAFIWQLRIATFDLRPRIRILFLFWCGRLRNLIDLGLRWRIHILDRLESHAALCQFTKQLQADAFNLVSAVTPRFCLTQDFMHRLKMTWKEQEPKSEVCSEIGAACPCLSEYLPEAATSRLNSRYGLFDVGFSIYIIVCGRRQSLD